VEVIISRFAGLNWPDLEDARFGRYLFLLGKELAAAGDDNGLESTRQLDQRSEARAMVEDGLAVFVERIEAECCLGPPVFRCFLDEFIAIRQVERDQRQLKRISPRPLVMGVVVEQE